MKALKYIFILVLVAIVAGAVYFSLQDGRYEVERSATIDAPPSLVYKQLEDFDQWANWNAYHMQSDVDVQLGEQTNGVDTSFTYTDEDGEGKMTITRLDPNKSISLDMQYEHSLGTSRAEVLYTLTQVENGTQVTMKAQGDKELVEKAISTIMGTDMDAKIGAVYEQSLNNLNSYLNNEMKMYTINVDGLIDYSGGYYLYMSSSSTIENLPQLQSQMLRNVHRFMEDNNIDSYGADMLLYEKFDDLGENVIFSAAVPVRERVLTAANSSVLVGLMEPQRAIKVTLKGDYSNLNEAWNKGEEYIQVNGLQRSEQPVFEVYKTDPYKIDNPANYITEIYLPVL